MSVPQSGALQIARQGSPFVETIRLVDSVRNSGEAACRRSLFERALSRGHLPLHES